jgi:hypothetical protein
VAAPTIISSFRFVPKPPALLQEGATTIMLGDVIRDFKSGPDFGDSQTQTTRFEGFAGAAAVPGTLTGAGQAERIALPRSRALARHL